MTWSDHMRIRLAKFDDISVLKQMYHDVIQYMNQHHIQIWDEIYPCICFENDILHKHLYVWEREHQYISAFALCDAHAGTKHITWEDPSASALYIDRFAVHVNAMHAGVGSLMLIEAIELAKTRGVRYVRLFVVDINLPAIQLYEKNGFKRASGVYADVIDEDITLYEFGYEFKL